MRGFPRAAPEEQELERLVECHGRELLAYARMLTRHAEDAEDALQDALLRVAGSPRRHVETPLAYLFAAVRNASLNVIRGQKRRRRREDAASRDGEAVFQEPVERSEELAALNAALNAIPAPQREVVMLKVWGGLTFGEIAEMLGIPRPTAASRYRYALDVLHKRLGAILDE
jgi:RNA polymerase sigma-70 factor (ECF subfamily)